MDVDLLNAVSHGAVAIAVTMSFVCLIVTVLSILPFDHWLFRAWEFPRLQISIICIVNILVLMSLNASYFEAVSTLCVVLNALVLLFQGHWILPYTPFYKSEIRRSKSPKVQLSVLTSNVLMHNRQAFKLIELVNKHQPDILITLESDIWWQQQLDDGLDDYPHRVPVPLDNLYGMHLYSKHPLSNVDVLYRIKNDIPSITCNIEIDEQSIRAFFVHPEPPSPTEAETAKPRDKELLLYAKEAALSKQPLIVTGDLNDVAWSPTTQAFREKSGLLDPRIGRGFFNTFHAQHIWARWPLDHIFVSEHFSLVEMKRLPSIGSDHFPLFTKLAIDEA
uniref:endonuclease/exonuclease/phosphatase family protein n=1 Tax=Ningiella ruwaisensis TaxID=2364274 RepID=UPI0010A0A843|nr:endonuclease/exonuclease/phosphatase family protein [Ningiella ruwaisensis]